MARWFCGYKWSCKCLIVTYASAQNGCITSNAETAKHVTWLAGMTVHGMSVASVLPVAAHGNATGDFTCCMICFGAIAT